MTRISENQVSRTALAQLQRNRGAVDRYSQEVSSGLKVFEPGDSPQSGSISQFKETLSRIEGYKTRIGSVQSFLTFQDDVLQQATDLLIRGKELAEQAANETLSVQARAHISEEVFQIRDHMVSLANSTYQGRYIYGCADDDDPPYDVNLYTNPATGGASQRYVFDAETGTSLTRTVKITDDLSITTNTPGNTIFDNAIQGLEILGRSLAGYQTTTAAGVPTGAGNAYIFPTDYQLQTQDIRTALDRLETARTTDILPDRVDVGARLDRVETALSLLTLSKDNAEEVIDRLQNADVIEASSNLTRAQTALEASLNVTIKLLNQSILDFI